MFCFTIGYSTIISIIVFELFHLFLLKIYFLMCENIFSGDLNVPTFLWLTRCQWHAEMKYFLSQTFEHLILIWTFEHLILIWTFNPDLNIWTFNPYLNIWKFNPDLNIWTFNPDLNIWTLNSCLNIQHSNTFSVKHLNI